MIPAFSPAERLDGEDSVGEEPTFEAVEKGLDWPGAVEEAGAEVLVSLAFPFEGSMLRLHTCCARCW